jgi:hypothetical protein
MSRSAVVLISLAGAGCASLLGADFDRAGGADPFDGGAAEGALDVVEPDAASSTDATTPPAAPDAAPGDATDAAPVPVPFTIGGPDGGPLYVDDDLVVALNGTTAYSDVGKGYGDRAPLTLTTAAAGDWVTMIFFDTRGGGRGHSEVQLIGPSVAMQSVGAALTGVGSSYPADSQQPFDILVFQLPPPGGTAAHGCLPDIPLSTRTWPTISNLTIHVATTKAYHVTWAVGPVDHNYTPDCDGWVADVFISSAGSWATVRWNTITHRLQTLAVAGHPYDANIATSAAAWAVQTIFPAGDMGLLSIE